MSIVLDRLTKTYDRHVAVNNVSLEVASGEFFVLLGPSGSGKSTVLRMIAGLTEIDQGEVTLHGRGVTHLPPQKRGVGFVFQNYALFRHMSVAENIEFALRVRRVRAGERRRRRDELLEVVGLAGLGGRMPRQLSGGQQQRVALARALAHEPDVLLLDEPFGALDARIRSEVRRAVRQIQRRLGVTVILVTHDQEEAFELADRMGVMNSGRLLEVGPPQELYLRPQTEFAATFLGTANLIVGQRTPGGIRVGPVEFPAPGRVEVDGSTSGRVQVLFRPEDVAVKVTSDALSWPLFGQAVVEDCQFTGSFERLRLRIPNLSGVRAISPPVPFGADYVVFEASRTQDHARRYPLRRGDPAWVGVRRIHALTHPGLCFLLATDGSPAGEAAVTLGEAIAQMAHARVTLLGHGAQAETVDRALQEGKERLGPGLAALDVRRSPDSEAEAVAREAGNRPYDLLVRPLAPQDSAAQTGELLEAWDHHVLLVPGPAPVPRNVLVCVAIGEPGKEDVLFAARLVRHLEAQATVMTVLPDAHTADEEQQASRFLAAAQRTLEQLGVPATTQVRVGIPRGQILAAIDNGGHDLLVIGTPLKDGRGAGLHGLADELVEARPGVPILLIRSHVEGP